MLGALARHLLVTDEHAEQSTAPAPAIFFQKTHRLDHGCERPLGIARAAAEQLSVALAQIEGIGRPAFAHGHDIHMRVEREDGPRAVLQLCDDVSAPRLVLIDLCREPVLAEQIREKLRRLDLAPGRVLGFERYEPCKIGLHPGGVWICHRYSRTVRSGLATLVTALLFW